MTSIKEIGKLFFETRKKKNITIEDVYKKIRIHPEVLNKIESGQFDKINKPYLKSFLKQYSAFLGIDTGKILEKYEFVSASVPEKSFNLKNNEEKAKKEQLKQEKEELKKEEIKKEERENQKRKNEALPVFTERKSNDEKIKLIFVAVLSAVLAILVFILFNTVRSKVSPGENKDKVKTSRQKEIAGKKKSDKNEKTKKTDASDKKSSNKEEVSTPPPAPTVILGLKARGKVWVQVNEGEKMLFAGVLEKGQSKTWKSAGTLTVWTGKADVLDFVVNTRKVNSFAMGVVKNIQVSDKGIRVGDSWVVELE